MLWGIRVLSVREAFEKWREECRNSSPISLCVHGSKGYSCCFHSNHPNVRYGGDVCPKDCPDFCERDKPIAYDIFYSAYYNSRNYYNEKYNIDPKSRGYLKGTLWVEGHELVEVVKE